MKFGLSDTVIGKGIDYSQLQTIRCKIDNLEMLYTIDLLDYLRLKRLLHLLFFVSWLP